MSEAAARAAVYEQGGHIVLCEGKRPCWKGWVEMRPRPWEVEKHRKRGGNLAIVPGSINKAALDVDHGESARFEMATNPDAALDSRRPGGRHLYYHSPEARSNSRFDLPEFGISGEIKSCRAYLVVWDGQGWQKLAAAMMLEAPSPFPGSLFEAMGVPAPPRINPPVPFRALARDLEPLEEVQKGRRNESLFDNARLWAYEQVRGRSREAFIAHVTAFTRAQNQRLLKPLPDWEVRGIARSIAKWTFDRPNWFDPEAQARRQRLQAKSRREARYDDRRRVHDLKAAGESIRAISAATGLPRSTVHRWANEPLPDRPAAEFLPGVSHLPSGGVGGGDRRRQDFA